MNQEILQKLGIKISEMSCNSLKRIYSSQIQEWTNTSGKDAAAFISDLVDERFHANMIFNVNVEIIVQHMSERLRDHLTNVLYVREVIRKMLFIK